MASRDVKVGLFVLISLLILGGVIFLIGDQAQLFSSHTEYKAAFKDVNGLSRGSPVRMGGVDIGTVKSLGYGGDPKDDTIYVTLTVVSSEGERIRADSVAEVQGKGFLGDKMIVITVGSENQPSVPAGGLVKTQESRDLEQIIQDLKKTAAGAERVIQNIEVTTAALAEESFHGDIKKTVKHLSGVMESIDTGEGYVARLLHDKAEADRLSQTVMSLKASAVELERLLASTREVVDRVKTGPGFAHELLYEESGSKALSQVGGAAEEVGISLKQIREGESLTSKVLYGKDGGEILDNLNQASADISKITRDVREGKGTLGAFLVDPTVYEDIKVLLGNVNRNRSLRALVRYSIKQDEEQGREVVSKPNESSGSVSGTGTGSGSAAASAQTSLP